MNSNSLENLALKIRRIPFLKNSPIWKVVRSIYNSLLRIITFNQGLSRQLYPNLFFKVSYLSRDSISSDFESLKKWDLPTLDYIKKCLEKSPDSYVFDVGANQGSYSMVMDRWVGEKGGVFAFEPEPHNLKILSSNIEKNHCHKVKVVPYALGETRGRLKLFGGASTTATLVENDQSSRKDFTIIDVITLDEYCRDSKVEPSIIKIDVEGFELQVLKGAKETLLRNQDKIKVICEIHTFMWADPDYDLEIIDFVSSCGLSIFKLMTAEAPKYIPDSSQKGQKVTRICDYGHYIIAKEFN
jgi:FkbM family methyltransferase